MTSSISFPGLFKTVFEIDPVATPDWFPLEIRWYGIAILIGMLGAFFYASYRAKQSGISFDDMLDYVIFTIPSGIIGARLYYVLFNLSDYTSFYEIIAIWNGGLAIYGGIIGGLIAIILVSKVKKIHLPTMLDCAAPGVMIGQICGRWGNFFNAEAYGILEKISFPFIGDISTPTFAENFPLRMVISNSRVGEIAVHPTFLYESAWNLLGFILINIYFKKKKFDGEIVLMYVSWYGIGRFFIEGLRGDSLMLGTFRVSQVLALVCFIAGVIAIIAGRKNALKKSLALDGYISQFSVPDEPAIRTEIPEKNNTTTRSEGEQNYGKDN
ncbi:MAG: prolipoprotein diacylglyceryl transferase [Clostridia bacterium]|nr:prolipoprotein diacylglyceryl transferase [Clostridia bacterium]